MNSENLLYLLMARAFLDIRIASYEENNKVCFALSDLFHNVPYQMKKVRKTNGSFEKILEDLKARAETKKLSKWLNIAITDISRIN